MFLFKTGKSVLTHHSNNYLYLQKIQNIFKKKPKILLFKNGYTSQTTNPPKNVLLIKNELKIQQVQLIIITHYNEQNKITVYLRPQAYHLKLRSDSNAHKLNLQ